MVSPGFPRVFPTGRGPRPASGLPATEVHNWAQAVSSAEQAGASAVLVFNDLDVQEGDGGRGSMGSYGFCYGIYELLEL